MCAWLIVVPWLGQHIFDTCFFVNGLFKLKDADTPFNNRNPLSHASVSGIFPLSMIQCAVEWGTSTQPIPPSADRLEITNTQRIARVKEVVLQANNDMSRY